MLKKREREKDMYVRDNNILVAAVVEVDAPEGASSSEKYKCVHM